jgi:hypothetical protein
MICSTMVLRSQTHVLTISDKQTPTTSSPVVSGVLPDPLDQVSGRVGLADDDRLLKQGCRQW